MNLLDESYYLAHPGLFTWLMLTGFILALVLVAAAMIAVDRRRARRSQPQPTEEAGRI